MSVQLAVNCYVTAADKIYLYVHVLQIFFISSMVPDSFYFRTTDDQTKNQFDMRINKLRLIFILGILKIQSSARMPDRTLLNIVKFTNAFITLLAECLLLAPLQEFIELLPRTLYSMRKLINLERKDFELFSACPKCHSLYDVDLVKTKVVKKCTFVKWPHHPQRSKRSPCNVQLLAGNSTNPKRVYCCRPISTYLKEFAKQPGFVKRCNEWRQRTVREGYLLDIYDGELWKDNYEGYLKGERNLYGLLNVDWVQVFTHTTYSLGVIYCVILNLPRAERYKEKNLMILGVIPGPTEPKLNINSYLRPIADDLLRLDRSLLLQDGSHYGNKYRFRILGCTSDLPATRKLGGFLSYHATKGK